MKILAVLAHPDDEAFGPAGTLARYALTGHTVRLATMTHGEAGSLGPAKHLTTAELGRLRSDELRCSAKALHLGGLNIYSLPDGQLAQLTDDKGLRIIRKELESFTPDILITFHSNGISGHPDHQTVARWCRQLVGEMHKPLRMLAYGITVAQASRVTHRKIFPIPDAELTHVIDVSEYLEYKFNAIRCHQSQSEAWERMKTVEGGVEAYLHNEHFSQVFPAPERLPKSHWTRLED